MDRWLLLKLKANGMWAAVSGVTHTEVGHAWDEAGPTILWEGGKGTCQKTGKYYAIVQMP